jgi:hypothetical protein
MSRHYSIGAGVDIQTNSDSLVTVIEQNIVRDSSTNAKIYTGNADAKPLGMPKRKQFCHQTQAMPKTPF